MSQNEVIEAVKAGLYSVAGVKPESIHAGIILCCMRGSDNGQQNKITVEEAARHLGSGVCAVDLAGAEALYPTEQYADLFAYAKQLRIPVTIHAGEAAGTESIRAAVAMGAARIGHGIRAAYDAETMEPLSVLIGDFAAAMDEDNITMRAVKMHFKTGSGKKPLSKCGFSSTVNTAASHLKMGNMCLERLRWY